MNVDEMLSCLINSTEAYKENKHSLNTYFLIKCIRYEDTQYKGKSIIQKKIFLTKLSTLETFVLLQS